MDSILTSIKQQLGITENYEHFDPNIIMHINSVFMILKQMGVGPNEGFIIEDKSATWSDFTLDDINIEAVKTYIYLKVKIMFDPPASGTVLESINKMIDELEWRLTNAEKKEDVI